MHKKLIFGFTCLTVIAVLSSFTLFQVKQEEKKQKNTLRTIVIDAGHGGHDGGAEGKFSNEKDVSLAVALKLGEMMRAQMPDVNVVLTRTSDVFHAPPTKANIANQAKGDLFISLHCNSAASIIHREKAGTRTETYYTGKGKKKKKKTRQVPVYRTWTTPNPAKGTETYIWGIDRGHNDIKQRVMVENASLYLDSATASLIGDFDPNSPEQMIYFKNKTKAYFTRSMNLALTVEDEFTKVGRISREARQRGVGIWVLQAVAMPSVLVEMGFISNPEEEEFLNSKEGQTEISQVIINAVKRYKYSLENHKIPANDTTGTANAVRSK
jgi:N-acetylmuramoyl-L-alanine amidase